MDCKISGVQVSEVSKWKFTPKSNLHSYSSNKTGFYKRTVAGVREGNGTLNGIWDPTNPVVLTIDNGVSVTLNLYLTAAAFYVVPAIIESVTVNVDIDTGDFVSWDSNFMNNGAWTDPGSGMMLPPGMGPGGGGMPIMAEDGKDVLAMPANPAPVGESTIAAILAATGKFSHEQIATTAPEIAAAIYRRSVAPKAAPVSLGKTMNSQGLPTQVIRSGKSDLDEEAVESTVGEVIKAMRCKLLQPGTAVVAPEEMAEWCRDELRKAA